MKAALQLLFTLVPWGSVMDDLYAINAAKTEFRDAHNRGEVERFVTILDPAIVVFSDGCQCAFGAGVAETLGAQYRELAAENRVHLDPIIIEIRIEGSVAYDYGWHVWTLTPISGGDPITRRERYVDIWRKNPAGEWKLWMYMNNEDVPMQMPQTVAA
jgi:ketosteroid isomerase-like protein